MEDCGIKKAVAKASLLPLLVNVVVTVVVKAAEER
jgi:hypothetical protein